MSLRTFFQRDRWLHVCPSYFRCHEHRVEGPFGPIRARLRAERIITENPHSEVLIRRSPTKPGVHPGLCLERDP